MCQEPQPRNCAKRAALLSPPARGFVVSDPRCLESLGVLLFLRNRSPNKSLKSSPSPPPKKREAGLRRSCWFPLKTKKRVPVSFLYPFQENVSHIPSGQRKRQYSCCCWAVGFKGHHLQNTETTAPLHGGGCNSLESQKLQP